MRPATAAISTIMVDDHPLFRQGLRQVVEEDGRFVLAGEAADGEGGLKLLRAGLRVIF